jgi:AcrR family transcriptional regulator
MSTVRRQSASKRREQLTEAAIEVIAEAGLDATTTRRVAERAGVPLGIVHYAFASKDELLAAVIDTIGERIATVLRATLETELVPADPETVLTTTLEAFWRLVETDRGFQLMQYELTLYCLRRPDSHWLARRQYETYCEITAHALREVLGDRADRIDTDGLARLVVASIDGLTLQFLAHSDQRQAREDLAHLITALLPLALG